MTHARNVFYIETSSYELIFQADLSLLARLSDAIKLIFLFLKCQPRCKFPQKPRLKIPHFNDTYSSNLPVS